MKWEYLTVEVLKEYPPILDEYGKQGWELVTSIQSGTRVVYLIFKRPLKEVMINLAEINQRMLAK